MVATVADAKIADAFKFNAKPSFLLSAGSPALTGANFTGVTGFQSVAYRGAFDGSGDWTRLDQLGCRKHNLLIVSVSPDKSAS
ncbi:hypothetical protein LWM68_40525 [Niabella sp. W65]|nr:hypothetical protein [Niabella sp. W65]MCH7368469.1 hypothetical protein [Niabella sp. W65]